MFSSPSSLSDEQREAVARAINNAMLDVLALGAVARKAHWNVRGLAFGELHKLFGKLYAVTTERADVLAEYVAMLGVPVLGDHVDVAEEAQVDRLTNGTAEGLALCEALLEATKKTLAEVDAAAQVVGGAGDRNGEQLLIDASIAIHKLGWMLAAHLSPAPRVDDATDS